MLVWTLTFQHRHFYVFYYRKLVMRDDLYKKDAEASFSHCFYRQIP